MNVQHQVEVDSVTLRMFGGRGGYRVVVADTRLPHVVGIAFLDHHLEGAARRYRDAIERTQARIAADKDDGN